MTALLANMKKIIPIVAAAVFALITGKIIWSHHNGKPSSHELVLHGNVDIRQVELAFEGSGRIEKILATEGEKVKAGQLLATLDTERLRLSLAEALARAEAARQLLARYHAGSRPEEIRQARAQRDAARATEQDAQTLYQREQSLADKNFVSRQQADNARFALDRAKSQLQAAEETLRLAQLGPRKEDVAQAKASLDASVAQAAVIRRDIAQGELHAPQAGVIENRILEAGDMASPQKAVLTLALTSPLWVRTYLPETTLARVPQGAAAWVETDSHPGKRLKAWVGYVSPTAEFTPKSVETSELRTSLVYQTRVFVCGNESELRLGMPATVILALDQPPPKNSDRCSDGG